MAAADCILALTERLTKKPLASSNLGQSASSNDQEPRKRISIVAGMRDQGKDSPDVSNNIELGLLLWKNLDNLIVLVEKLHSVCSNYYFLLHCWLLVICYLFSTQLVDKSVNGKSCSFELSFFLFSSSSSFSKKQKEYLGRILIKYGIPLLPKYITYVD